MEGELKGRPLHLDLDPRRTVVVIWNHGFSPEAEREQMKRPSLNERRQVFLAQEAAAREIRARLLAPPPRDPELGDRRRRTWVIVTLLASMLAGGGLALGNPVTFHVPLSVIDAVWPRL